MRPIQFIHCADLHIDSPFKGLSEVHPDLKEIICQSTYLSFNRIVERAIKESVDCVLISGDIYNSADKSLHAQIKFRNELKRLSDARIPSFIVYGNHDPLDSWSASLIRPDKATIFGGDKVECFPLVREGRIIANIFGISFPIRDVYENLALRFEYHKDNVPAIGLLHSNVGKNTGHKPYAPASIEDLSSTAMDYWALGHVHKHVILKEKDPAIVYPGNPQAINSTESGAKGCCLVTLYQGGECDIEFIPTDIFRYQSESLDISGLYSLDALINSIKERCENTLQEMDGRHAIIRLSLEGRTDLHQELQRGGNISDLLEQVRECLDGREPWIWLEKIILKTAGTYDIGTLRDGENFLSDLICLYDELAEAGSKHWDDILKAQQPLFSEWQGGRYLEELSPGELLKLLEEARNWTLDSIIKED
ncbi:MAG: metallophosphoesterase family protein [bacterium]